MYPFLLYSWNELVGIYWGFVWIKRILKVLNIGQIRLNWDQKWLLHVFLENHFVMFFYFLYKSARPLILLSTEYFIFLKILAYPRLRQSRPEWAKNDPLVFLWKSLWQVLLIFHITLVDRHYWKLLNICDALRDVVVPFVQF